MFLNVLATGLFSIAVLENLSLSRDRHDESLKQTAIFEEIRDTLKNSPQA